MATPHVAGTAALVLDGHPGWTAADVRSAIVNTAVRGVLKDAATGLTIVDNPNIVGAGLENAENAVSASISLDPVSIGYGAVPSGSGQGRADSIVVKNLTSTTATFTFAIDDPVRGWSHVQRLSVVRDTRSRRDGDDSRLRERAAGLRHENDWAWLEVFRSGVEVAHAALYTRTK